MDKYNINLNIHYTAPKEVWDKIEKLYSEMPHWKGFVNGCPLWYGEDGKKIDASVEPGGLQFYAVLPTEEWEPWITLFKNKASEILGYEIGEPEYGFAFHYYD